MILHIESIPLINEIKEGLELSLRKTKNERLVTIDPVRLDEIKKKQVRINELLIHIYNTLPACTHVAQE